VFSWGPESRLVKAPGVDSVACHLHELLAPVALAFSRVALRAEGELSPNHRVAQGSLARVVACCNAVHEELARHAAPPLSDGDTAPDAEVSSAGTVTTEPTSARVSSTVATIARFLQDAWPPRVNWTISANWPGRRFATR